MIKSLGHTAFNVEDMDKSLHFYRDQLGFKHLFELKDGEGKPWINYLKVTDRQFIELFYNGVRTADINTKKELGYNHLCLEADNIKETVKELESRGIVLDEKLKQGPDLNYQCWIRDPDGNRIEIMELHPDAPQLKG